LRALRSFAVNFPAVFPQSRKAEFCSFFSEAFPPKLHVMENETSIPPVLPGYEILERLGTGGTSTVWLAKQLSLDRVVAIKILSPTLLADTEERAKFQEEARAAARLSHPSIVSILDFGDHDGTLFYVMEYVDGTNLADWLAANQRMAHGQVIKLADIIGGALETVWRESSLIHCDIKPGNILLGTDGAVKLTDLGLARIAGSAATREPSACIEGTPTYIAPEQIEGVEPDCRTDIYSLGLTLYHLLTGTPPFEGRSLDAILDAQQTDYLPDPCNILPRLPVAYGWLLAKMTAKNPAKRPPTWTDVLKDIHQIESGKSPLPPYPADDESTILLNPRHRPSSKAHTINLSAATKKAIALSGSHEALIGKQKRGSASRAASAGGGGCLRGLFFLVFLAAVLGAIWFFAFRGHDERIEQLKGAFTGKKASRGDQIPTPVVGTPGRTVTPAPLTEEPEPAPEAQSEVEKELFPNEPEPISASAGTVTPGAWNHPGFIQAAELFNKTLTAYQTHLKTPDPEDPALAGIIADAQYAALLFETILPEAPADVPVTLYANQCYQLVNDARRARMTLEAKKTQFALASKSRHPTLAPYPTPAPDPTDTFAPCHMQFGYAWDTLPAPIDRPETAEFVFLLSTIAEATPDTRAQKGLYIHGPLKWLMPLEDACKALKAKPDVRIPIEGAPFPYGGLFMQTIPAGRFGTIGPGQPPYPTIRLITDSENHLVAIQLIDENPDPPLQNSPLSFSTVNKVMDFVTGRTLPEKGDVRVSHRTLKGDGTLRIDSEAGDFTDGPDGEPIFRSVLLLPQAVSDNLLYHLIGSNE
jgi:serine/threonine protein kinase